MAWITQRWGILTATLLVIVMITGAYLLGTGALKPLRADAISPTALLQSIATKDSDHDGLPNWEEALYGTNPYKADTFGLGMTDGEAVAKGLIVPKAFKLPSTISTSTITTSSKPSSGQDTLTNLFAEDIISSYMAQKAINNGASLSEQQLNNIVQQTLSQINTQVAKQPPYRELSQIKVSGSGEVAMRAYAAAVQKAFSKHTVTQNKGILTYLQEAVQNPESASIPLARIRAITEIFRDAAASLAQMTAPKEVAKANLELINAYARMANITNGLAKINSDPIIAMVSLSEYKKGVLSLAKAFIDLTKSFQAANVKLTPSDPGYSFVNVMPEIYAQQQQKP